MLLKCQPLHVWAIRGLLGASWTSLKQNVPLCAVGVGVVSGALPSLVSAGVLVSGAGVSLVSGALPYLLGAGSLVLGSLGALTLMRMCRGD